MLCRDYIQRYRRSFLSTNEIEEYDKLKFQNSILGAGFVVMIPALMVSGFSLKYDMQKHYPRFIQTFFAMGLLVASNYYVREKQKMLHTQLISKYFAGYSDQQIRSFD